MKAPDKIYVHVRTEPRPSITFSEAPEKNSSNVEYIRKDALLEWAKEKCNEYKQMDEDFQGNVFVGNRHALAEVIQKIESL